MEPMRAAFIEGVVVEVVGNEILILDAVHQTVHTFPLSYLDTVDALSQGKSVRNRDQLTELESLGLVATISPTGGVSRRAVLVGAGALSAALAMPTAALASSAALNETFFVGNDVFEWAANSGQIDVFSFPDPEPAAVLADGTSWTLTISGVTANGTVVLNFVNERELNFTGLALSPAPGATLQGRLSNSSGELSNLFQISETGSG